MYAFKWRKICGRFGKKHFDGHQQQEHAEDFAQGDFRDFCGPLGGEVAPYHEGHGQDQGVFEVGMAGLVVVPGGEKPDGREHDGQTGSVGLVL